MGALELSLLLLVVGVIAAGGGYVIASVRRRQTRRSQVSFVLGFCCGSVATVLLRPSKLADARGTSAVALRAVLRASLPHRGSTVRRRR